MSTKSYPVEDVSFSVAQYRAANPNGDGIVNDYAGNAFDLVLSADKGTISQTGAAKICLNGQILEVAPDASQFDFPAVTADTTYQVSLLCDPAKDKDALGALSLVSGVKGQIVIPSGGTLVPIWEVPRRNGTALVPTSPKVDLRRWTGDSVVVGGPWNRPSLPRGSFLWDSSQQLGYVRDMVAASLKWVMEGSSLPFAMASGGGPVGNTLTPGEIVGPLFQPFPAGRFTVPPNITVGYSDTRCTVSATAVTVNGFNIYVRNVYSTTSPAPGTVAWTAVQMTSTSAKG